MSICFISCASAIRTLYRCSTASRANIGQARKDPDARAGVGALPAGRRAGFPAFLAAVEDYAQFHWQHMKAEEDGLPLAEALGRR
jgi:hypothetical protein